MATLFDSTPTSPRPVNQPLIFTLSDTALQAGDRFIVRITIQGQEVYKVYLQPNQANKAHFDASKVLKDLVSYDFKNHDGDLTPNETDYSQYGTGAKTFALFPGLFNGSTEAFGTSTSLTLVKGAQQAANGLNPSWAAYTLPTAGAVAVKAWLTDLDVGANGYVNLDTHKDDLTYHGFLQSGYVTKVRWVTHATAGGPLVSVTKNIVDSGNGGMGTTTTGYINYVPTSYSALVKTGVFTTAQLDAAGFVRISLLTSASQTISKVIQSTWDCYLTKGDKVQLAYGNQNGGIDYLWFEGRTAQEVSTRQKTYMKPLGNWNAAVFDFKGYDWQEEVLYREATQTYELFSRHFSDKQYDMITSAIKSTKTMIRIGDGDWMPVIVETNSFTYKTGMVGRQEVSFKVKLAQQVLC